MEFGKRWLLENIIWEKKVAITFSHDCTYCKYMELYVLCYMSFLDVVLVVVLCYIDSYYSMFTACTGLWTSSEIKFFFFFI